MKNIYFDVGDHHTTQETVERRQMERFQAQLLSRQQAKQKWALRFAELINEWDPLVCQVLNQLAQILWPPKFVLKLIPVSVYRLRDRQVGTVHLWWIERDIPPFDRYQCAAYLVYLSLSMTYRPVLSVQSGQRVYPITPATEEQLITTVMKAGQEPPLIISRNMGIVTT